MKALEAEERAQFMLLMRARGVQDLAVLRALERAPRARFMPQRYRDVCGQDIALPIGGGQTAAPPSVVAMMAAALRLEPGHSVLEIGSGTGYASALVGQMAGKVAAVERCQSLALEAAARLKALGVENVAVHWADGLDWLRGAERFDRILVHALIEPPVDGWMRVLNPGGALVAVLADDGAGGQRVMRLTRGPSGAPVAVDGGMARSFRPLARGVSGAI